MKIALISDTHIGITKPKTVKLMAEKLAKEDFDILIHAGDYCGGTMGHKTLGLTLSILREAVPDKEFLSVIGNHDYWCGKGRTGRPSLGDFVENYEKILELFKQHNVHFLDTDGIYLKDDLIFFGSSGWYNAPRPPTNDENFLPMGLEGDTNRSLEKKARAIVYTQLDEIEKVREGHETLVFISHFPVIKKGNDYKGRFEDFSWDARLGDFLQEDYGCKHFLNGHAHQHHEGPLRYECGSDYYNPKYMIIEI